MLVIERLTTYRQDQPRAGIRVPVAGPSAHAGEPPKQSGTGERSSSASGTLESCSSPPRPSSGPLEKSLEKYFVRPIALLL
jgi:hypothetical protein